MNKYKIGSFYGLVQKQPQLLEFGGGGGPVAFLIPVNRGGGQYGEVLSGRGQNGEVPLCGENLFLSSNNALYLSLGILKVRGGRFSRQ